jgi:cell division protein FtsW (lipid II flippase)
MDRSAKVADFIRREVLWFLIGAQFSALLSFTFHLGDWLTMGRGYPAETFLLLCFVLMAFFSKRSTRQR